MIRDRIFARGVCTAALACGLVAAFGAPARAGEGTGRCDAAEARVSRVVQRHPFRFGAGSRPASWSIQSGVSEVPERSGGSRTRPPRGAAARSWRVGCGCGSLAPVGATTPGIWANIGPTKADFLKNGSVTLNA